MVPPLLLLSLTGTIAGEELVIFDGRGVQPFLRRLGFLLGIAETKSCLTLSIFWTYCLVLPLLFLLHPWSSYIDHYVLAPEGLEGLGPIGSRTWSATRLATRSATQIDRQIDGWMDR